MANRVVIGELPSGDYGIKISRRGQNVLTATGKDLLFDSTVNSGQGRYLRKFASATSASGFNNYVPTNDGTQDTENASGQEYHPLFLYIQDGTGITYDTNNMNTSQLNFIPYNSISTGSEYCKDRFFRVQGTGTTFTVVSIPFPYDVRSCKYISIEGCYNDNTYITAPFTKVHTFHRNIGSNLTVQDYQYTGIINNNFINIVLRASNTTTNFNWVDIQISNTAINDFYFSFMLKERHSII